MMMMSDNTSPDAVIREALNQWRDAAMAKRTSVTSGVRYAVIPWDGGWSIQMTMLHNDHTISVKMQIGNKPEDVTLQHLKKPIEDLYRELLCAMVEASVESQDNTVWLFEPEIVEMGLRDVVDDAMAYMKFLTVYNSMEPWYDWSEFEIVPIGHKDYGKGRRTT